MDSRHDLRLTRRAAYRFTMLDLFISSANVNSLPSKLAHVLVHLLLASVDVLLLQETKLGPSILDEELLLPNYCMHIPPRPKSEWRRHRDFRQRLLEITTTVRPRTLKSWR